MQINILVLCDKDLHETEAGGSRTVIMVNNYLAAHEGVTVYSSYRHLSPVDSRIIEIPLTSNLTKEAINKVITEKKINILLIPEGGKFAHLGRLSVEGTNCKVITEFHTKPGFEIHRLWYDAVHNLLGNGISIKKRIYSIAKILLFPVYRKYFKIKNLKRFQQAYNDADRLVVLSNSAIEEYKKQYFLKENHKIVAIENALSFKQEAASEELSKKSNTILIVSRLEERSKRLSIVFKVWGKIYKKYPDWDLQIVGSGIDEQLYRKMVNKMKLENVTFYGHTDPENYYTKASIFLMTSAYEGWGMALTEAMQKGCVPVCMDSFSAVHEIIDNNTDGFIVPNNNIKELIKKTEFLISHSEIRKSMGVNGITNCVRFSMNNIGPKWIALFKQVILKGNNNC
jgi:glycosyltransferase involved in cell wall biosynthesis